MSPKRERYEKYLKSEEWFSKRLEIFKARGKTCQSMYCSEEVKNPVLHLHHVTYQRLGNEKDEDLLILCEECHKLVHKHHKGYNISLKTATENVTGLTLQDPRNRQKLELRKTEETKRSRNKKPKSQRWKPKSTNPDFVPRHLRNAVTDSKGRLSNPHPEDLTWVKKQEQEFSKWTKDHC